ncbi:MAG: chloride channel protein, partial [Pseudomonadota bacterium]
MLLMIGYALAVGVVAGVAAWAFRLLIGLTHNLLFLGTMSVQYDANVVTAPGPWGWGVIFVPVVGAILVAWLVDTFAPEAKGHGVPEVMHAIHNENGMIRPQVAIVKSLASAISIGSGASVGREGPIVQIGSAFGSILGQIFPMNAADRSLLIAAGAGGGIAATFNAPLGGLLFTVELLMLTVNVKSMLIVATSTATATLIGRLLIGDQPSFNIPALQQALPEALDLPTLGVLLVLAILGGALSALFIRALYKAE